MALTNLLRKLDLTTLQLFLAVYEERTLTRAGPNAKRLPCRPRASVCSNLSMQWVPALFVRKARGMELTAAGETLLHHARRVLRDIENIGLELAEHASGVIGYCA